MELSFTRNRLIVLGVVFAAIMIWVVATFLWPTDRKKIGKVLDQLAAAAEKADTDAVMAVIAPEYRADGMDRKGLEQVVRGYFQVCGPTSVWFLKRGPIAIAGNLAATEVVVFAQSAPDSPYPLRGQSRWQLSFRKRGGRTPRERRATWLVTRIMPMQFESRQVNGWEDVPRFGHE